MKPQLKKIVDTLNESDTIELLEYVSERVRTFNRKDGKPSIDLSQDPEENLRVFLGALSGAFKKP